MKRQRKQENGPKRRSGNLSRKPEEIQNYVAVQELAHRKKMNHSEKLWKIAENVLPDYRGKRKCLKEYGGIYLLRMDESR